MNESFQEMIGKQVRVSSLSAHTDVGILKSYEHPWLTVLKPDGKLLCFPVYTIRLVEFY